MSTLITILHVIVCLFLMLTVLLQSGKGGGMGAAFGGGNAATVFGGSGASSFLRRLTAVAATVFMLASMILAYIASHNSGDALEKFGAAQEDLASQKEQEKARALGTVPGTGSAVAPTGSATAPLTSPATPPDLPAGSAAAPGPATPSMGASPTGTPTVPATTGTAPNPSDPGATEKGPIQTKATGALAPSS